MPLITTGSPPLHWALAGAGIGFITLLLLFIGWSITGMCPGPILVNVGEGKLYALPALAGALVGAAGFAGVYRWLKSPLRLPEIKLGTGDG
jgi:hypothetical protein